MTKRTFFSALGWKVSLFAMILSNTLGAAPTDRVQATPDMDEKLKSTKATDYEVLSSSSSAIDMKKLVREKWDYIIVGAGAAGTILARKLSDDKHKKVLLLEVGINRVNDPVTNTAAFDLNKLTYDPRYSVNYTTLPYSPTGNQNIYSEGRMWGGGTGHHYMNAVRGVPQDYDDWASQAGDSSWNYNNILKYIKRVETYTTNGSVANPAQRGTDGKIFITQQAPLPNSGFPQAIINGLNIPYVEDYNDPTQGLIGVSQRQQFVTPDNTTRSWVFPAYLPIGQAIDQNGRGVHSRKLQVLSNALVNKVLFKGTHAKGVEFFYGAEKEDVYQVYGKHIILSAGAINSPAILQRSGIGDAALLDSLGIPVVVNNPNVGQHLQNHYGIIGFIQGTTPNIVIGFTDVRPYMPADGERRMQMFAQNIGGNVRIIAWVLRPQSTGNMQIVSSNPHIEPLINFNYFSDGSFTTPGTDAYLLVSFYKLIQDIAAANGTQVLTPPNSAYPAPWGPAPNDSLLFAAAQTPGTFSITSHIVGTARMGTSAATGVVDSKLKVHGTKHLWVVDSSIQPNPTSGNQCWPAYTIGLKGADLVKSH